MAGKEMTESELAAANAKLRLQIEGLKHGLSFSQGDRDILRLLARDKDAIFAAMSTCFSKLDGKLPEVLKRHADGLILRDEDHIFLIALAGA